MTEAEQYGLALEAFMRHLREVVESQARAMEALHTKLSDLGK